MEGMEQPGNAGPLPEIDVTLIEESLKRTPTERWQWHQSALKLVLEIERAARAAGLREDHQGAGRREG